MSTLTEIIHVIQTVAGSGIVKGKLQNWSLTLGPQGRVISSDAAAKGCKRLRL
jgi:hypothetical protein